MDLKALLELLDEFIDYYTKEIDEIENSFLRGLYTGKVCAYSFVKGRLQQIDLAVKSEGLVNTTKE